MRDKIDFRHAVLPIRADGYAHRPNGVIASLDYGIFNVFMRVSVSPLRVVGYMGRRGGAPLGL